MSGRLTNFKVVAGTVVNAALSSLHTGLLVAVQIDVASFRKALAVQIVSVVPRRHGSGPTSQRRHLSYCTVVRNPR